MPLGRISDICQAIASPSLSGSGVRFTSSAVFADFLSPYDPAARDSDRVFYPPQGIHFFDEENNFSLRPFSYGFNESFDPDTFEPIMEKDY